MRGTLTLSVVVISLILGEVGCSSNSKGGSQKCTINEECAQGYRCSGGVCVDIYHPSLLPPQNTSK